MSKIIIIYSTTDGHTREICSYLRQVIEEYGNQVISVSIDDKKEIDLKSFDKIVIGASIRYGKHHKKVYQFIKKQLQILEEKSSAFFSVNVVARKPEKNQPDTNPYLKKFLTQISWKPKNLAVFAGKIDYQKYSFWDRSMIRFIMWMTNGPTDPKAKIDFTNWNQVKEFGQTISKM
ncbi:MAG: menaquinone-dependent protoporphyrinogen IX dehydrogenase [Gammaproteobacteria bacterium]|nr:menaquinone-dependent protoporphyrinogen IX dehydrogenase [Gammaproteobacteria bacterium]